jgi:hypothetical protein
MMFIRTHKMKCICKFDYEVKFFRESFQFKKGHIYEFYKDKYGYRHMINDEWNWCLDDIYFSNLFEVVENG